MLLAARMLGATTRAEHAARWALVGKLGRIRSRKRGKGAVREFFLAFRPYGRVWSHRGIRLTDEETARRLMERRGVSRQRGSPTAPPEHDDEPAGDAQSKLFEEERIP